MNVGDKVYCYRDLHSLHLDGEWFSKGNIYSIKDIDIISDSIWIMDNSFERVVFSLTNLGKRYVNNYFYTEKEYRKMKLERLDAL